MSSVEELLMRRPATRGLLSRVVYAGRRVNCPCCDSSYRAFAAMWGRPNRLCWNCGALERHREIALLLRRRPHLLRPGLRILHIAPEPALRRLLLESEPVEYVTADLDAPGVDLNFDLTAAPLDDDSFDVILCNHVLEHIPDDRAALSELKRMLAPGGWSLVLTPIHRDLTVEDPTLADPQERLRRFGQVDHVRRYGWDYLDRLAAAGFAVEVVRLDEELPPGAIDHHQLRNPAGYVEPLILAS
jgi:SAM-dependent methyltransferase